jgi:hypothetical protein
MATMSVPHPVSLDVMPPEGPRRRLTVLLRPLLVLPHALLVGVSILLLGGIGGGHHHGGRLITNVSPVSIETRWNDTDRSSSSKTDSETTHSSSHDDERGFSWDFGWGASGALGTAAATVAMLDWFAVLFLGSVLVGAQGIKVLYLRWRARVLVYATLLRDEYPPFGEGDYPASLVMVEATPQRRRGTVFLRLPAAIPHLLVLAALAPVFLVLLVASWVLLLIDGRLPPPLWRLMFGVVQWTLRVEAYLLLMHDEYPPFSLAVSPPAPVQP